MKLTVSLVLVRCEHTQRSQMRFGFLEGFFYRNDLHIHRLSVMLSVLMYGYVLFYIRIKPKKEVEDHRWYVNM